MASVAAGGVAAGALGAAEAQGDTSSGKLFACYSKKTKQLKFSKSAHCRKGSKLVSWNQSGPQGPQGAPGGAGAIAAYVHYGGSVIMAKNTSAVVAAVTPASTGEFLVNGTTFFSQHPFVSFGCAIHSKGGARTPDDAFTTNKSAINGDTVANTGVLHGGPASPLLLECRASSYAAKVFDSTLDAVRVSAATQQAAKPSNSFSGPAVAPLRHKR